jgi:hypothetical protein
LLFSSVEPYENDKYMRGQGKAQGMHKIWKGDMGRWIGEGEKKEGRFG